MGFAPSKMTLSSSAFAPGHAIPARFTGDGDDVSPPLRWTEAPAGAQSFAVICHDPDAPLVSANGTYGFVHWVLYNIPADVTELNEGDERFTFGINDFGKSGFNGPLPPQGHGVHHYYFWVLALSDDATLPPDLSLWQLLAKLEPKILGMNRLIGSYERV